jgi:2-hydroxyglutaryl-CoA dehydratase, D-component
MSADQAMQAVVRRLDDALAGFDRSGVGFVGPDLPIEVLIASGRSFGHLPWRAAGPTVWADRWLESSFPFWARSILEQWQEGAFDGLDCVVFSRADDASQRLYYYVRELKRRGRLSGPSPLMFDIALVPRDSSLGHTESAIVALMQALDVSDEALTGGIERANGLRTAIDGIERSRSADGPLHERLARAALWTDPTRWIDAIAVPGPSADRLRILLAGSTPVDARIHEAVETTGASIVAEANALAPVRLGPPVSGGDEPGARRLARHLRQHSVAPRAFLDRGAWLVARAEAAGAAAVILWLTREDEALAWAVPAQRRALAAAGLPALVLPAARWQADDDTLDTIMDFCRGIA